MNAFRDLETGFGRFDAKRWEPPYVGDRPRAEPEPELRPPTAAEIEAIEEAAREAGFEAGFERGYNEGQASGHAEAEKQTSARREKQLRETVEALESLARAFADPLAASGARLEPELLVLVTTLARQVIGAELETRPDLVRIALSRALEQLPSRQAPVRVRINSDDRAVLDEFARDRSAQLEWVADPDIGRGGCLIESGASRIDARIETRLRQSVAALWGDLAGPAAASGLDSGSGFEPESEVAPDSDLDIDRATESRLESALDSSTVLDSDADIEPEQESGPEPVPAPIRLVDAALPDRMTEDAA